MLNLSERVPAAQIEARLGRPMTKAESDRYEAYLVDAARCEAINAKNEADYAARLFAALGDRPTTFVNVETNSNFELTVAVIGRTAEVVETAAANYARKHDGKLPRITAALPWHGGFRLTITRRESI